MSIYSTTFMAAAQLDDEQSWGEKVYDYARYGVGATVVSGGLGIVNTATALANVFGTDFKQYSTAEALEAMGAEASAQYARENSTLVDFGGFVVSSIVPGMVGVKALHAAQAGIKAVNSNTRLVTGLRATLIPKDRVAQVTEELATKTHAMQTATQYRLTAAKQGFHQAALESAFAETAILLTTNQHSMLNPDDLGYFESIQANLGSLAIGTVFGTGIGGALRSAQSYHTMSTALNNMFTDVNKVASVAVASGNVGLDKGSVIAQNLRLITDADTFVSNAERGAVIAKPTQVAGAKANSTYLRTKLAENINAAVDAGGSQKWQIEAAQHLNASVYQLALKAAPEEQAAIFSGLKHIRSYNAEHAMFDPVVVPSHLFDTGEKPLSRKVSETIGRKIRASEILNNPKSVTREELSTTLRREIAKASTTPQLKKFFDTPAAKPAFEEMLELSKQVRAQQWTTYGDAGLDSIRARLAQATEEGDSLLVDQLTLAMRSAEYQHAQLLKPENLIADAFAAFNDRAKVEGLRKRYPNSFDLLAGNSLLRQRVGETEALLDLKTGDMFKVGDRTPTIADLGEVKLDLVKNQVRHAQGITSLASKFDPLKLTAIDASAHYYAAAVRPPLAKNSYVKATSQDFPRLTHAMLSAKNPDFAGKVDVEVNGTVVRTFDFKTNRAVILADFKDYILDQKIAAAKALRTAQGKRYTEGDLARILDVDIEWAQLADMQKLKKMGQGFWSEAYDPRKPTVAKFVYDSSEAADPMAVKSMNEVQQRISNTYQVTSLSVDAAIAKALPGVNINMPETAAFSGINKSQLATPLTEGAGFVASAQGKYGGIIEFAAGVGQGHKKIKVEGQQAIDDMLRVHVTHVTRDPQALTEYAVLDSKLRQHKMAELGPNDVFQNFIRSADPTNELTKRKLEALEPVFKIVRSKQGQGVAQIIREDATRLMAEIADAERFPRNKIKELQDMLQADKGSGIVSVQSQAVADFMRAKVKAGSMVVDAAKTVASLKGKSVDWNPEVWYPGRLDRGRYEHVLFVRPKVKGLFGDRSLGIVGAPTDDALQEKRRLVAERWGDDVEVLSTTEMELRHKNILDDYDSGERIDEYFMNYGSLNKGVAWDVMPDPTPQVVQHAVDDLKRQWSGITDQFIQLKYAEEWSTLDNLEAARLLNTGAFGQSAKKVGGASSFQDIQAMMLNRPNNERFKRWREMQTDADALFSKVWHTVASIGKKGTTADYTKVNELAKEYGLPIPYTGEMTDYLVRTEKVSDSVLADLVPAVNYGAVTAMLRLDYIQPIINAISLPILAVPEIKHLMADLPELARTKALARGSVRNPSSGDIEETNMPSMMQAVRNWFKRPDLREQYIRDDLVAGVAQEYHAAIDDLSLQRNAWNEPGATKQIVKKGIDKLASFTDWSEQFTRFVAADMARQVLEGAGIKGPAASLAMRTYVNRVVGNYTYAQRPGLFQGFGGQAIGLFQTYQFNLIQQLTRHMGERPSAAAAMMGLQTGIFGLQSTPGFELLNDHIAKRSQGEEDFYTGINDAVGTDVAEWIMYGAGSNFPRVLTGDGIDLFSRGNLNPRSMTIVPTSLEDVVAVSMSTKALNAVGGFVNNISQGAPVWDSFKQALSVNGVNRPLAGIGQLLAGYRPTTQGGFLLSTEDLDAWQTTARLLGTKGLDESIAVNSYYRAMKYKSWQRDKLDELGDSFKVTFNSGDFDTSAYNSYMEKYTELGGDLGQFERWVDGLAMRASQSQIYEMYKNNDSPEGRYMQKVMGGNIEDYINPFNLPE